MLRELKINLEYQATISGPPKEEGDLYRRACEGDKTTVNSWKDIWLKNYQAAVDRFGDFGEKSMGLLYGVNRHKPAIVCGSGPSLQYSISALKQNRQDPNPVMSISALHNFGYFEDEGCHADYYLSLDSGKIVMQDISEGRKEDSAYYWDKTKDKTLIAYVASDPELFEKWQGKIYLFNSKVPDSDLRKAFNDMQLFTHYISSGGNAGGACMYAAKALMGSSTIIYVGMDFCFGYDDTFHSYKTQYDNVGNYIRCVDVFGNSRKSWQSYYNFKLWLDNVACTVPGIWVNCSEGILGAYRQGNIAQFQYMPLTTALVNYQAADTMYLETRNAKGVVEKKEPMNLREFWGNPKNPNHVVFF